MARADGRRLAIRASRRVIGARPRSPPDDQGVSGQEPDPATAAGQYTGRQARAHSARPATGNAFPAMSCQIVDYEAGLVTRQRSRTRMGRQTASWPVRPSVPPKLLVKLISACTSCALTTRSVPVRRRRKILKHLSCPKMPELSSWQAGKERINNPFFRACWPLLDVFARIPKTRSLCRRSFLSGHPHGLLEG